MNDEALAKVMTRLENEIGPEALSKIRREAASRGVTVMKLLGDAVAEFAEKLAYPTPHKAA